MRKQRCSGAWPFLPYRVAACYVDPTFFPGRGFMTDRTRTPVVLPAVAAACLVLTVAASSARAQTSTSAPQATGQTSAPASTEVFARRHIDVDVGVGAHVGIKNDAPIDDDVLARFGVAAPIASFVDGELQATYLSGSDNDDDDDPTNPRPDNHRDSRWLFDAGARWYPIPHPDATARFFVQTSLSFMLNYYERDDFALGMTIGPGVRLRAGQNSGLVVRAPIVFGVENDSDAMILPSLSYFWQF
jgi:hypothetical protein